MAIGDNNYGNGSSNSSSKLFENTYYSRIRFKNNENKLALSPYFRSGLLYLDLSEMQEGFKYNSVISMALSPTKARLLANEIIKFKEYLNSGEIVPGKAFGVNGGMGDKVSYIGFHSDIEKNIYITIGKIDGSGNIIESRTTSLNKDYHFALEWNNIEEMDVSKSYNDYIELDQIYDMLVEFARSMSGASAYATLDLGRYDYDRLLKKLDPIYDRLGIERKSSSSSNNYSRGNSFLDNASSVSSNHVNNIDDLME